MKSMRVLIAILLAGCSSTPKQETMTKEELTANCRPAIDHLVAIMLRGETGSVPLAEQLRSALFERCTIDKWSGDATTCFQRIKLIDQAGDCAKYLTIPQRDAFQQAIESVAR